MNSQVHFPPVTVFPNYAEQVMEKIAAGAAAHEASVAATKQHAAETVHPEYRLNAAERTQMVKQAEKAQLQELFPIGTACVEIRSRYGNGTQQKFNIVTKFTKAGYPVLDNGKTLRFKHFMSEGFCVVARTHSNAYGWDNRTFMACAWA
jgi:hypothetical protein